jgi:hypothetical protein
MASPIVDPGVTPRAEVAMITAISEIRRQLSQWSTSAVRRSPSASGRQTL